MAFGSIHGVVKLKFVKLSSSSCDKWTSKDWKAKEMRQHSVSQHEDGLFFNFI